MPIEYPSDRVERQLRELVAGLQPGDRLPGYGTLAEQLDTSRATVTKAMQRLEADGVVTVLPNYGTFKADQQR